MNQDATVKSVLSSVKTAHHHKLFEGLAALIEKDFGKLERICSEVGSFTRKEVEDLYHALGYGKVETAAPTSAPIAVSSEDAAGKAAVTGAGASIATGQIDPIELDDVNVAAIGSSLVAGSEGSSEPVTNTESIIGGSGGADVVGEESSGISGSNSTIESSIGGSNG